MNSTSRDPVDQVASLAEPVRRRLYEFVAAKGQPVDRETAANGVGIGRPLAAFHLDRLVGAGLLDVVFRRRSGRSGPGAGRPAKFYVRPDDREVAVHLPARGYDVAAEILAEGVERAGAARQAVLDVARERGRALAGGAPGRGSGGLVQLLEREGYEPFLEDDVVRLRNCPFHSLADEHRELTCAMNFALLDGAGEAVGETGYRAVPQPRDGQCCVAFVPEPADGGRPGADAAE